MFNKTDRLVALRMLVASGLPEQPEQTNITPLSRKLLSTLFPRRGNNVKETFNGRGTPVLVYGRTKEKQ
jgi:hypothetical protein